MLGSLVFDLSSAANFTANSTRPTNNTSQTPNQDFLQLWQFFLNICYASGIYLSALSILTVLANGILLLALYKDPFRNYRHPATVFIIGLALADFLTGIAVDPLFAYFYFRVSEDKITKKEYNTVLKAGGILSAITMNVSFLVVLCLSWTQLAAIIYPHRHKQIVTTERAVICVTVIWIYAVVFSLTILMGVPTNVFQKIDVFAHLTIIHILVIISHVCLYVSYKRQLVRLAPFQSTSAQQTASSQYKKSQRQLVVVNLLLTTCLLVFVLPVTVVWYVTLYWKADGYEEEIKATIANVVIDTTLFLKFLIDPFIYALRLSKFRRAVAAVLKGRRTVNVSSSAAVPLPRSAWNQ